MRQRDILRFWLPLLGSWLLMTSEGPVITASVSRLPAPVVMLAATGIVIALSVAIESPIIQLLATATATVRDAATFRLVRRFTVCWMVALTGIHLLFGFTPVFDLVVRSWMGTPEEVARWVRLGMRIMVPWSAAIAWRRFLQGVLIRHGRTRLVVWGTAFRLLASGGSALGLLAAGRWPGVALGTFALVAGVVVEALFVTLAVGPLARTLPPEPSGGTRMTMRELWRFHLPLAATSMLSLLLQPLVAAALARLDRPRESLAAWPIVFHLTLWLRAPAFAFPETVISLADRPGADRALGRFSARLCGIVLFLMVLFLSTPLAEIYLGGVQNLAAGVAELARSGLFFLLPFPALATLVAFSRGQLIVLRRTAAVNLGMAVHLTVAASILAAATLLDAPGLPAAGTALTLAAASELATLRLRARATD